MGSVSDAGCGQKTVRYLFIIFNVIFSLIGVALVIAGSYGVAKVKSVSFDELKKIVGENAQNDEDIEAVRTVLTGVAGFIIFVGLMSLILSSCGWIGACKQNTCLLFTFSVLMGVIVLVEFIVGITVLVVVKKLSDPNDETGNNWIDLLIEEGQKAYHANVSSEKYKSERTTWNLIQAEGHCCGVRGPHDWNITKYPPECFDTDGTLYKVGCLEAYEQALKNGSAAVGGVAITFCLIEIFGIVISCYLACTMKQGSAYEQH